MIFPQRPLLLLLTTAALHAGDSPQWGAAWSRNMVSPETGLPARWDAVTGENIKWRAALGTETHSSPVVAGGRVFSGTNNNLPRDPKHHGDRGVLLCLDEKDGRLLWQLVVPKRSEDRYHDWPDSGISSPATVEGDRVYVVSNRGEVMCLDAKGLADGNDGPFKDEARHMTPADRPALELGPLDADILWLLDLTSGAGIWSHDAAHSSILIDGPLLYLNSGTGVDNTHRKIRTPNAPSLVVVEKASGRLVARDHERIAPDIFHCTWSAPSMAELDGRKRIFFCGGNGLVYAFSALTPPPPSAKVQSLERWWRYDPDPAAPKSDVHRYTTNRQEGPSNVFGMPVFDHGRLYVAGGGDIWWGKNESWLHCVDAATGNAVWKCSLGKHVLATPAVSDGIIFIGDVSHTFHCLDAATGRSLWTHDMSGEIWASALVADGKVYVGTRRGQFCVFAAAREKNVLFTTDLRAPISATCCAANGTLYVATMAELLAIGKKEPPR